MSSIWKDRVFRSLGLKQAYRAVACTFWRRDKGPPSAVDIATVVLAAGLSLCIESSPPQGHREGFALHREPERPDSGIPWRSVSTAPASATPPRHATQQCRLPRVVCQ